MKYIVSILFPALLFVGGSYSQEINWQQARHWKIYNIPTRTGFTVSADSLRQYESIALDSAKMIAFLKNATPLPSAQYAWMGAFVTSCELSSAETHKVLISTYGGMFFDENTKKYFQVPRELRSEWLEFLNEAIMKMR
jgi:hypothetical protein